MADFQDTPFLPENRVDLENLIELALARLDELDGDADLEDDGLSEPWISAQETGPGGQTTWLPGFEDREWDTADAEPSLGSVERGPERSQVSWAFTGDDDREDEVRRPIAPRRARNGNHSPALRLIDGGRCK